MKTIRVGSWPFPTGVAAERQVWLLELPKMKNGSPAYTYDSGLTFSRIIFKRNEDATAFRLKFDL
jgi:hypothetical protein